jgi:hypothetical protein
MVGGTVGFDVGALVGALVRALVGALVGTRTCVGRGEALCVGYTSNFSNQIFRDLCKLQFSTFALIL